MIHLKKLLRKQALQVLEVIAFWTGGIASRKALRHVFGWFREQEGDLITEME